MNSNFRLEKIEITAFGKLKNVVITPTGGINMLNLPNESGKSTLAAFIKYVFYGFTGTKKQSVAENEKLRYMPWDGSPAKGAIVVSAGEKIYRVARKTGARDDSVSVTDVETGEPALRGMIPGVAIFGINEDTFAKTLFVGRAGEASNGDPTLAESLRNLLFSADEKTNADKAMKKLKDSRAYLKNMQYRGVIPTLEERCKKLEADLVTANRLHGELSGVRVSLCEKREQLAKASSELDGITAELENLRCFEAGQRLNSIYDAREAYAAAQTKFEAARSALGGENAPETQLIDALADDNANLTLSTKRLEELTKELTASERELGKVRSSSPFFENDPKEARRKALIFSRIRNAAIAVAVLLAVTSFCFFSLKTSDTAAWITAGVAFALFATAAVLAVLGSADAKRLGFKGQAELLKAVGDFAVIREKARGIEERVGILNSRYSEEAAENRRLSDSVGKRVSEFMPDGAGEGYSASIRKIYAAAAEIGACKADWMRAADSYKKLSDGVDINALTELASKAQPPKRDRAETERELAFTQSRIKALSAAVTDLEKRCAALEAQSESPAVITSRLEVTERRLDEANTQYRALSLAIEVLEEACDYMKATVSPKLAELTGGYLEAASGGRYSSVGLTTNLEMTYDDNGMEHNADHLSDGAKDTAYLAMRFALVELIYDDKRPFMILDDSFCHLDDERLAMMLRLIKGLAESQQIFLFCCRSRERKLLDIGGIPYTLLTLGEEQ